MCKNKKCAEKRKFRSSRAVLDAILNSDDDSDEADSSDWESNREYSSDGETRLDDDTQSDDDQTASVADSKASSASDTAFTWSDRATVLRQRFFFIGNPGIGRLRLMICRLILKTAVYPGWIYLLE